MPTTEKNVLTSFSLHPQENLFIEEMIQLGRFANKSEVIRAGLRLLQDYEYNQHLQRLRASIAEGEADYEAGRYRQYGSAEEMTADIIKRGREQSNHGN